MSYEIQVLPRKRGFGIIIFPTSWHFGYWPREKKSMFAFGPLRFVLYKLGPFKLWGKS